MTALARYAKLEAEGRYFDGQSAQPREVILSFGERTLVIMGLDDVAIAHWPLASLRALGARRDSAVQLVPEPGSDERLVVEDRQMLDAIAAVCPELYRRQVDGRTVGRAVVWAGAAVVSVLLIVFVLVPALAGTLARMMPPDREQQLGDAVVEQLRYLLSFTGEGEPGFCEAKAGSEAMQRLTDRLVHETGLPYPLRVSVIDHSLINAVAMPGGRILVFRGLIDAAESPEELAGVLAHEIGHALARDPTREALRAAGTAGAIGLLIGDVFGASAIVVMTDVVVNASYQRDAETHADETAYRLLSQAGLPTVPFAAFFERMRKEHDDSGGAMQLIASHPGLEGRARRAAAADTIGDAPFEPALSDRDWIALRGICHGSLPRVLRP